jgi:glutamate dehydrogenase (NAD(P)+)
MVSYFEQVQNNINFYWEEADVDQKLSKKIKNAANDVFKVSEKNKTHMRNAAYMTAMTRVFSAMKDR